MMQTLTVQATNAQPVHTGAEQLASSMNQQTHNPTPEINGVTVTRWNTAAGNVCFIAMARQDVMAKVVYANQDPMVRLTDEVTPKPAYVNPVSGLSSIGIQDLSRIPDSIPLTLQ